MEIDITDAALAAEPPAAGAEAPRDDVDAARSPAQDEDGDHAEPDDEPGLGVAARAYEPEGEPGGFSGGFAGGDPEGDPGPDAADPDADPDAAPPLRKILESILLVVDQPVPEVDLAQVLEVPRATVLGALEDLAAEYLRDERGFELRQVAGGWRLYTTPDCAAYVERFVLDGQQARLTQAALETLAVIAYRQPVSRQSVAAIRGVNVDGVVRTLLGRGLIAEAGEEGPGGAHLYVTTPYFLERLGLRSLDELPNLAPLLPVNVDDLSDSA